MDVWTCVFPVFPHVLYESKIIILKALGISEAGPKADL